MNLTKLTKSRARWSLFKLKLAEAVSRSLYDKLVELGISVKDFGANGNGSIQTTELQNAFNNINKKTMIVPEGTYKLGEPVVIRNADDWVLDIRGDIVQDKHGYNAIIIDNCKRWTIKKNGRVMGHGAFPAKNIGSTNGGGEKRKALETTGRFGQNTGNQDQGIGTFGGGFIGCVGSAITIRNGCEDFYCGVNTSGFNGYGVIIGDLTRSLSNSTEPLNKNGLIDGVHQSNYIAGIGLLACDNVNVADEVSCLNNGHPDALSTDDEINPGYGVTSILTINGGNYARNCTVGSCNLVGNKRKGFDVHTGLNIRCESPYIADSFIHGISYGGASGVRDGGGWVSPKIVNCGTATGGKTDSKTAISASDSWQNITPSGVAEIKNSGIGYTIYWKAKKSSFGNGFIIDNSSASWVGNRPLYVQGSIDNILDNLSLCDVTLKGNWRNPALIVYAEGILDNWIAKDANITSSPKGQVEFQECNIKVGSGSSWGKPLFNIGNRGTMEFAKTELTIQYDGTNEDASIAKINSGAEYVYNILGGGSGLLIQGVSSSDDPAVQPPFEQTAQVTDASLHSANYDNVQYESIRAVSSVAGGRQQITISPRRKGTGAVIPTNDRVISSLILSVQINWHFQY